MTLYIWLHCTTVLGETLVYLIVPGEDNEVFYEQCTPSKALYVSVPHAGSPQCDLAAPGQTHRGGGAFRASPQATSTHDIVLHDQVMGIVVVNVTVTYTYNTRAFRKSHTEKDPEVRGLAPLVRLSGAGHDSQCSHRTLTTRGALGPLAWGRDTVFLWHLERPLGKSSRQQNQYSTTTNAAATYPTLSFGECLVIDSPKCRAYCTLQSN